MQSQLEQAEVSLKASLRLNPNYEQAHSNLGIVLMRQGKSREGATEFATAANLNPRNPEAQFNLGLALWQLDLPADAASCFLHALRLEPNEPKVHYHLAMALARQNNRQEAVLHAQAAQTLAAAKGQEEVAAQATALLKEFGAL